MSLFSSPAFRVFSSENSESQIQRKPGTNALLRRPFLDKTVNCNTPEANRKQKPSSLTIEKPASPQISPNLDLDQEHVFSYKKMEDQYEDKCPYSKRLEIHQVYSILKNYTDDSTPPPSPTFEEPLSINSLDSSFSSDKSYDEDIFFALQEKNHFMLRQVDEIDLPVFNIDDL